MTDKEDKIDNIIDNVISDKINEMDNQSESKAYTNSTMSSSSPDTQHEESEGEFTIEYMRFDSPVYHITYKGVEKTLCGRDLTDTEYKSTTREPDLLDPCQLCQETKNQLSEKERVEKSRSEIGDVVEDISEPGEEPGKFTADEITALMREIPTDFDDVADELDGLRTQLSLSVKGINNSETEPGKFTRSEMESLQEALQGIDLLSATPSIYLYSSQRKLKRTELDAFKVQKRGGKGVICYDLSDEEQIEYAHVSTTRKYILFLTDSGKIYQLKANELPVTPRTEVGTPSKEAIGLDSHERIQAVVSADHIPENNYLSIVTREGYIKRITSAAFRNIQNTGIQAIELEQEDDIVDAVWTDGTKDLLISSSSGRAIRFEEQEVREMGRTARGVYGIDLESDDWVAGLTKVHPEADEDVLTVTANGFGKRTNQSEYRRQSRNGVGLKDIVTDNQNGPVADIGTVTPENNALFVSSQGQLIHIDTMDISSIGRNTQGVTIMELEEGDRIASMAISS